MLKNITRAGVVFNRITDKLYRWENRYFIRQWYITKPYQYLELNKVTNKTMVFDLPNYTKGL